MSIEHRDGKIFIECDVVKCDAEHEGDDFESAWKDAARKGWRYKRIGRDVVHGCPKHAREI